MADSAAAIGRPWARPEALLGFLGELRLAGFNLDTDSHIAAQDLLLALTARGETLSDPRRLSGLLGPLVCTSPRDQDEFRSRFEAWIKRLGWRPPKREQEAPEGAARLEREVKAGERGWRRWLGLGIALIVLILAAAMLQVLYPGWLADLRDLFAQGGGSEPAPPPVEASPTPASSWELLTWTPLLGAAIAGALIWRWWWGHRARLYLESRPAVDEPSLDRIPVRSLGAALFDPLPVFRAAQGLRRRVTVPSRRLDVTATLQATLDAGGWLTPVMGTHQLVPEYLVLVDRTHHNDQQARLADELVERLVGNEVHVVRYDFDGDPRTCFPHKRGGRPLTLGELAATYPSHRLLIFGDGSGLFSPLTGELEVWAEQLLAWRERALFTPEPGAQWGSAEEALADHFLLVPASIAGLSLLARVLGTGGRALPPAVSAAPPLPATLRERPLRWVGRDAPDPGEVAEVLDGLQRHLGEAGFYWLCALAVYPALDWYLTVYLGHALRGADDQPLLDLERLARLARLPWLRHGQFPDWLRLALTERLDRAQTRAVREALQALLMSALDGAGEAGSFNLEIAREHPGSFRALARSVLRRWSRQSTRESPLRDYVFLSFMSGRRLALGVPNAVRDFLLGHKAEAVERSLPDVARALRFARFLAWAAGIGLAGMAVAGGLLPQMVESRAVFLSLTPLAGLASGLAFAAITLPYIARRTGMLIGGGLLASYPALWSNRVVAEADLVTQILLATIMLTTVLAALRRAPRISSVDTSGLLRNRAIVLLAMVTGSAFLAGALAAVMGRYELFQINLPLGYSSALYSLGATAVVVLGLYGRRRLLLAAGLLPILATYALQMGLAALGLREAVSAALGNNFFYFFAVTWIGLGIMMSLVTYFVAKRLEGPGVFRTLREALRRPSPTAATVEEPGSETAQPLAQELARSVLFARVLMALSAAGLAIAPLLLPYLPGNVGTDQKAFLMVPWFSGLGLAAIVLPHVTGRWRSSALVLALAASTEAVLQWGDSLSVYTLFEGTVLAALGLLVLRPGSDASKDVTGVVHARVVFLALLGPAAILLVLALYALSQTLLKDWHFLETFALSLFALVPMSGVGLLVLGLYSGKRSLLGVGLVPIVFVFTLFYLQPSDTVGVGLIAVFVLVMGVIVYLLAKRLGGPHVIQTLREAVGFGSPSAAPEYEEAEPSTEARRAWRYARHLFLLAGLGLLGVPAFSAYLAPGGIALPTWAYLLLPVALLSAGAALGYVAGRRRGLVLAALCAPLPVAFLLGLANYFSQSVGDALLTSLGAVSALFGLVSAAFAMAGVPRDADMYINRRYQLAAPSALVIATLAAAVSGIAMVVFLALGLGAGIVPAWIVVQIALLLPLAGAALLGLARLGRRPRLAAVGVLHLGALGGVGLGLADWKLGGAALGYALLSLLINRWASEPYESTSLPPALQLLLGRLPSGPFEALYAAEQKAAQTKSVPRQESGSTSRGWERIISVAVPLMTAIVGIYFALKPSPERRWWRIFAVAVALLAAAVGTYLALRTPPDRSGEAAKQAPMQSDSPAKTPANQLPQTMPNTMPPQSAEPPDMTKQQPPAQSPEQSPVPKYQPSPKKAL